ncbi:MAG: hypothetical protein JSR17_10360 [Proteobacteria bacterium]|nr:hypothetical protein [Pseudomonadota bacterium]
MASEDEVQQLLTHCRTGDFEAFIELKGAVEEQFTTQDLLLGLCEAAKHGHLKIVSDLLYEDGVRDNANAMDNAALREAVDNKHVSVVLKLYQNQTVQSNLQEDLLLSIYDLAIETENADLLRKLIREPAVLQHITDDEFPIMLKAAIKNQDYELLHRILKIDDNFNTDARVYPLVLRMIDHSDSKEREVWNKFPQLIQMAAADDNALFEYMDNNNSDGLDDQVIDFYNTHISIIELLRLAIINNRNDLIEKLFKNKAEDIEQALIANNAEGLKNLIKIIATSDKGTFYPLFNFLSDDALVEIIDDFEMLAVINSSKNYLNHDTIYKVYDEIQPPPEGASLTALEAHYFAMRFGHTLGLDNPIKVIADDGKIYEIKVSGGKRESSARILNSILKDYIQSDSIQGKSEAAHFSQIQEAVDFCLKLFIPNSNEYKDNASALLLSRYREGKLTFISSGWPGHGVGIALYGNYLVYANRGEGGDKTNGTQIFEIKNKNNITQKHIEQICNASSQSQIDAVLKEICDMDAPVAGFPSKDQEHGTCSFVNPKAAIEGMLFLSEHAKHGISEVRHKGKSQGDREAYKHFTHFAFDHEIEFLLENAKYAQTPQLESFFLNLIKTVIFEHHGQKSRTDSKMQDEIARVATLIHGIPDYIKQTLIADKEVAPILDKLNLLPKYTGKIKM